MKKITNIRTDRLRKAMEENGATVKDITVRIYGKSYKNKDYRYVNDVVNGRILVNIETLVDVCNAVNCSANYLLGLSDEMY